MKNKFKNIVVLGGGTAGWLSALFFNKKFANSKVTLVESKEIGIIGVGEGTTPNFVDMLKQVDISVFDLIKHANATIKNGILFKNWSDKDFIHAFSLIYDGYQTVRNKSILTGHFIKKSIEKNISTHKMVNPVVYFTEENKIAPLVNGLPMPNFALHFDAFLLAKYLKSVAVSRGVVLIEQTVKNVVTSDIGIESLMLSNGTEIKADFYVDCSGFNRVLMSKLNATFIPYEDMLVDSAIPVVTKKTDVEPFTTTTALSYGWMWKIPTKEKTGYGYVYSSKYVSDSEAEREIVETVNNITGDTNVAVKRIKFKPGRIDKVYFKNVLAVGLSAHFIEPLEATSLSVTCHILSAFVKFKSAQRFNDYIAFNIDSIKEFVILHYVTNKNNTAFWINARKKALECPKLRNQIELWEQGIIDFDYYNKNQHFSIANYMCFAHELGLLKHFNKICSKDKQKFNLSKIAKFEKCILNLKEQGVNYKEYYKNVSGQYSL
jgi:hypothetical protein